jgi:crossover junction endodeoxyribonuclease RuvC
VNQQTMILGIDPGLQGALALYCYSTNLIFECVDMPITAPPAKKEVDGYKLSSWVDRHAKYIRLACIEDVGAMTYKDGTGQIRGQGAAASFAFGQGSGIVIGALASYMIPMRFVSPSGWKMAMGLSSSKGLSRERATALFPCQAELFKRAKDDGRAEACLLALFGARGLAHLKS